jgi:FdhD protein
MLLPCALRQAQQVFERTGGLHAAGLFDQMGRLLSLREDIGRHNAVDKLVGQMLQAGAVPLRHRLLLVSGRVSFEIVQKAAMAGVPILCAVSAASSLAIEAAQHFRMTLVGFLRDQSFNIYTHPERIVLERSKENHGDETIIRPTDRASGA